MAKYVSGTRFRYVTVHGMDIPRTSFGDGFDTGDILLCDSRETNGMPRFLCVISRDGQDIGVTEVGVMSTMRNLDDAYATVTPALGVTVGHVHGYRVDGGVATFPDGSGIARPWDGNDLRIAV